MVTAASRGVGAFGAARAIIVRMKGKLRIGASGWVYIDWRGGFYPEDLPAKDRLRYYASQFATVEINASFYRTPSPTAFAKWRADTPPGFVFTAKAHRFLTHRKRLTDPGDGLEQFYRDNVEPLGPKLEVVLFQSPPRFRADPARLAKYLTLLRPSWRYAFEFRDHSWHAPPIYELLEAHGCAFCVYELGGFLSPLQVTADFVYARLHGPDERYKGSYSDAQLQVWAERTGGWLADGRDVYLYFDNDEKAYAARDAKRLREAIG